MRSRYSAFARRIPQYLFDTLHPSKRSPDELAMLEKAVSRSNWLGLQIISTQQGQPDDNEGQVAFRATYEEAGQSEEAGQNAHLEENSLFIKEAGRWYYLQGQFAPDKLPGRNDPCWCGSGRKFKKCHG